METTTITNYCRVCGNSTDGNTTCMNCGCDPNNGNAFCNNCGAESLPHAVMCPKCKHYFPAPNTTPYVDTFEDLGVNAPSSTGKWVLCITAIAVAVIGLIVYNNNSKSDGEVTVRDIESSSISYPTTSTKSKDNYNTSPIEDQEMKPQQTEETSVYNEAPKQEEQKDEEMIVNVNGYNFKMPFKEFSDRYLSVKTNPCPETGIRCYGCGGSGYQTNIVGALSSGNARSVITCEFCHGSGYECQ